MKTLLAFCCCSFLSFAALAQDAANTYTVQEGDSPAKIAKSLQIKLKDLLAANPGVNPKNLQIGQILLLPASAPAEVAADPAADPAEIPAEAVAPAPGGKTYTVKKGDTPERIARRLKIKLADLLAANPELDSTGLQIGQKLQLP
ncbi:MAG: hypothetical protein RL095_1164 [Verrucomicrobiota bacterium]|jgi:LysM repeat protein